MTQKRIQFVTLIRVFFFSLLFLLLVASVILQVTTYNRSLETNVENMRSSYIAQQRQLVKREVLRVVEIINYRRSLREQKTKEIVKERVYEAFSIAQNIYEQNLSTKTPAQIKQMILDALRPIRFAQGTGYYFITRLDGVSALFADKPELERGSLLEVQDPNGKFVVKDMISITEKSGEGFYEYRWTKPKTKGRFHHKIAFIKGFTPYNWFIGAGLYVGDTENITKATLLAEISRIRFGQDGYIFINNLNGDALLVNGSVAKRTRKLWQTSNRVEKVKAIFAKELAAATKPEGGYINYSWGKLKNVDNERLKVSFIHGVPGWNWLVGAGFYVDDVEAEIAEMRALMAQSFSKGLWSKVFVAGLVVLLSTLLLHFINRRLMREFDLFAIFLKQAASGGREIDCGKVRFMEFFKLAGDANTMLYDKNAAQERLRELAVVAEQVDDGISIASLDGTINFVNKAWVLMHGYQSSEELLGRSLSIFHTPKQLIVISEFNRALKQYGHKVGEVGHKRKDGTTFPAWMSVTLLRGEDGEPYAYAALTQNITERKEAEDELLKLRKLESVGVLAGGIAHDFNNLLTGLFGNIELAKRFLSGDHKSYKYLETAERSLENATGLTKQFLTFAKGGDPVKEIISITSILTETVLFSLRGSNLKPQIDIASDLWSVEADRGQFSQVISNLIINAQQAMSSGGVIFIIASNVMIVDQPSVQITIRDEGDGIAPDDLGRIFDPYFSTKYQGRGLGLASVYSIIKKHNGTIKADSRLDEGTTFTICLPAVTETVEVMVSASVVEESHDRVDGVRILVLDDDAVVREVLGEILHEMGHEVVHVAEGRDAVVKYQDAMQNGSPFALVIADLTIPGGMGGLEATREILQIDPEARVIVSSGYATDPVMTDYAAHGFRGRVAKPYRFTTLQEVVEQVLGG